MALPLDGLAPVLCAGRQSGIYTPTEAGRLILGCETSLALRKCSYSLNKKKKTFSVCVCVCVDTSLYSSEDSFSEFILSLYKVCPGDQTQVISFGGRPFTNQAILQVLTPPPELSLVVEGAF